MVVRRIMPGSPAEGQLVPGDVIVEVNREAVRTTADLGNKVKAAPSKKPLLLLVKQGNSTRYVAIEPK